MYFYKQISKSLCFNFLHYVQEKIICFSTAAERNQQIGMKNNRPYSFQTLANISGNFRKISGNIKFPENLQPQSPHMQDCIRHCTTQCYTV